MGKKIGDKKPISENGDTIVAIKQPKDKTKGKAKAKSPLSCVQKTRTMCSIILDNIVQFLITVWHLDTTLPLIMLVLFTLFGALGYYLLEAHDVDASKEKLVADLMAQICTDHRTEESGDCLISRTSNKTLNSIKTFATLYGSGHAPGSFVMCIYLAITVYTTIGYGNIVSVTVWGRLFTFVYTFVGIPLMVYVLACLGKDMCNGIRAAYLWAKRSVPRMKACILRRRYRNKQKGQTFTVDPDQQHPLSFALIVCISWQIMVTFFYVSFENWTFGQSLYFVFISLSTIGFGDLTPVNESTMVLGLCLIIVGLALFSMTWSMVQAKLEQLTEQLSEKIAKSLADAAEGQMLSADESGYLSGEGKWVRFMGAGRRKRLQEDATKVANSVHRSVQTQPLMATHGTQSRPQTHTRSEQAEFTEKELSPRTKSVLLSKVRRKWESQLRDYQEDVELPLPLVTLATLRALRGGGRTRQRARSIGNLPHMPFRAKRSGLATQSTAVNGTDGGLTQTTATSA